MRALFLGILLFALSSEADFRERYKEGKFAEALTELEQSPEAAQKNFSYYLNRGLIHHALNQEPLAYAYLTKAKALNSSGAREVDEPLAEATAGLVKWLGVSRLDATSYGFEIVGDYLPLDLLFFFFGVVSILAWVGFFFFSKRRPFFLKSGLSLLALALWFGLWSMWNEKHPLVIVTESRLVKSGPGETYLDRGAVEPGMKLRIVGQMFETEVPGSGAPPARWWKVRFNDHHDLAYLPERSGLLLTDESNTPGT
jgi:tetratricopeptide (TPR) repeat protein